MGERLIVYGASGHGKVIAEAARLSGWDVLGFVDDDNNKVGLKLLGYDVLRSGLADTVTIAHSEGAQVIMAIGPNHVRKAKFEALVDAGVTMATVIHPSAMVAPSAMVGAGTIVCVGAVIGTDARIGMNVIVNTGATIDHDCVVGDHAHTSPGSHLGGTVVIGDETHVAIGATVRNNLFIGARTIVGVGAAVVADIPDGVVAYGCPARIIRKNETPSS